MERRRMYLAMQEKERAEMGPEKYDKLKKANDNIQIDTNQEFQAKMANFVPDLNTVNKSSKLILKSAGNLKKSVAGYLGTSQKRIQN